MTLVKGGMFENSTIIPASKTISLPNVFELMEDQNYTVDVSFSVYEEEHVIQNFTNFCMFNVMF